MTPEEKEYLNSYVRVTAGKLISEDLTSETVTVEKAKSKTENCVGAHILHDCIDNCFDEIISQMSQMTRIN
ncbi:hypothetical protein [Elizabethkingia anophelis]|uniref:hypothetical protein n=1 Tax=Elizabethkingia anophelis TaxID=1117645 RepID=UPI001626CD19|nr:hypothetical protein [Elizabethkingia anophelis]